MPLDNKKFREALGSFATGVCIVTIAPEQGVPIGMTINSFSSVSLEPPLVLWSIQNNSECFDTFNAVNKFAINILPLEHQGHSNLYARRGEHALEVSHYRLGCTGSPLLRDALTTFECRVWARYPGGDHQIIVGEVLEFATRPTGKPLLFYKGKYAQLH